MSYTSILLAGIVFPAPQRKSVRLLLGALLLGGTASAQAPVVVSTSPGRNAVAAPRTTPVVVTFNQPLSTAAATQQALKVFSQQAGGKKAGTATVSGNTLQLTPAAPFKAGETVLATVTTAVRSNNDQPLARAQVFQFTTATARSAGVFIPGSDPAVSAPTDVAMGDVDGDRDLDVLTSSTNGTVSVRLNDGSGSFSGSQQVSVGLQPLGLALADVDSDGDLDLLATLFNSMGSNAVSVRLNNGAGTFSGGSQVAVGFGPTALVVADVDGDGDLDVLTCGSLTTVSVRLNNGMGVFGGGSEVSAGNGATGLAVGDIDNDGDVDLLVANFGDSNVSVRLNDGAGVFSGSQNVALPLYTPTSIALEDVDRDGDLDFAATGFNPFGDGVASVHLNEGGNTFSPIALLAVGTQPVSIKMGDVDGDGDADVAVANYVSNTVSIRLNSGQRTFGGTYEVAVGRGPVSVALGDVDGDNTLDILTANGQANTASVRLNSQVLASASAQKTQPLGLYPNPAQASVRLQLPTGFNGQATQVRVLNALGQEVVAQRLQGATLDLALPSLAPGIYTVQLTTNQGNLAARLVVE